ncbi:MULTISPECIES: 3-hexulose-6-phosphate synthase [unclassified Bacillus (in: firmicutes)]|uniref:3-hexulose-6-phosphate synthase n=1 Tax=unclassified Bacillus (in: firmicutes) TaxID=185979 RepID=UPI0008DFC027|nr:MULTISPECIES: 3-hexulose-6-phosphate synthase [unclassified Bacillus (in: firmicutes)]SFB20336.1 3-hexulose-6-phosphate synthase [Bacillus sp. UNCCL13]SFQ90857.1 3-hexulose-6-phosphate synthase [Bacillus sp. cl95]
MKIQLALDRINIEEAISLTKKVEDYVDWIEVGTSLIKEFGMRSVAALKEAFPDKTIVADMKTIDNAVYECKITFDAGADVVTVMGVSPLVTIETCLVEAEKRNKRIMIDLLNTDVASLPRDIAEKAVLCLHTSKDQQELSGSGFSGLAVKDVGHLELAIAGGITLENIDEIAKLNPAVVIIGSAITKAAIPAAAANQFMSLLGKGAV